MQYRLKKQSGHLAAALCAAALAATNACSLLVDTSVSDDGTGGSAKDSGGAANAAGNNYGGSGGTNSGGTSSGGASSGGTSSGGTSSGSCLGQPNEFSSEGWYIDTGVGASATVNPPVAGSSGGQFQDGSCVCIWGTRRDSWANVYFDNSNGKPFTNLSIKLINASPDLAWPTLYVWPKNGAPPYCRTFSDSQLSTLESGQPLTIFNTDLHNTDNDGNCSTGQKNMPAGEPISRVQFQVDTYQDELDFDFCVQKLTVNP